MGHAVLDLAAFRAAFPEFGDPAKWPDAVLERHWQAACAIVSPKDGKRLHGRARQLAIDSLTAHLAKLEAAVLSGGTSGLVAGASVDKVSVTLTPPPLKNQREWWYSLTPYGQQCLMILRSKGAGGLYVGGTPAERDAFRKAGGVFVNGQGHS